MQSSPDTNAGTRLGKPFLLLALGILIASAGCREIQITTTVNRDGSFERAIVVPSDSSGIGETALPMPDDESWRLAVALNEESKEDEEDDSHIYTLTKQFRHAEDLNEELSKYETEKYQILSHLELTRRHRWFTTYITYRETYEEYFPFRTIPLSEYLTPEEIVRLRESDEEKELEDRMEEWQIRNMFEHLMANMLEGSSELNMGELTPEILGAAKEEFFQALLPAVEETEDDELVPAIVKIGKEIYETEAFELLTSSIEEFNMDLLEYSAFYDKATDESYKYTVVMRGLIYDSNSSDIHWNSVTWEFSPMDFSYADYEMWVESRVTNRTAVWVSIILLVFLVTVAVVVFLRRG